MNGKAILTISFSSLLLASPALAEPGTESSGGSQSKTFEKANPSADKQITKKAIGLLDGIVDSLFDGTWVMDSSPGCEYGMVVEDQNTR